MPWREGLKNAAANSRNDTSAAFRRWNGGREMFAILRGANGRRHEVDFNDDPVIVDVSMSDSTVQITMTAADPGDPAKGRYVTVALPRVALLAAMASANAQKDADRKVGLRLVDPE
jgi:hypothetical protein